MESEINESDCYKYKEYHQLTNKDFYVHCNNPSMLLIMMSMLRKSYSLHVCIDSLIIINKEYYNLLDFEDSQVKYLRIY